MELSYTPFSLQFKYPFGVSSNTRMETQSVVVKLESDGYRGYGEACLPAYLGESLQNTILFFETLRPVLKKFTISTPVDVVLNEADRLSASNNAGKAAIDIALNDLAGKTFGKPWYELAGLGKSEARETSFTIGIDAPEKLEQKIKEAADFKILKIKAGTKDDKELIKSVRRFTDKPLYVDVNQGWTNKNDVLHMLQWLGDQGVVLVEQPMPVEMKEEMRWVRSRSPIPVIADESVKRLKDLERLDDSFSGINIKLMKCTGLGEAKKMISFCREHGLKVMLGCMAESSCGTSAVAQLMGLADYIDLDAPLLYKNDPFTGISYMNGMVQLTDLAGLGVIPVENFFMNGE